jgi:hypothetical protein
MRSSAYPHPSAATPAGSAILDVQAGLLSARLVDGALTDVTVDGDPLFDRVYAALRDQNWGTVPVARELMECQISGNGFTLAHDVTSIDPTFPFSYRTKFTAEPGRATVSLKGRAEASLRTNRIGFCLLHPIGLAGSTVRTKGDGQEWSQARTAILPTRISPTALFSEITGLEQVTASGHQVRITFIGDLFETEDQRNWIDGSYKTYCTPLRLPFPRELRAGDTVEQHIVVEYPDDRPLATEADPVEATLASVQVAATGKPKSALSIGVSATRDELGPAAAELIRALAPAALTVELDLSNDWRPRWDRAAREAATIGVPLEAILVTEPGEQVLEAFAAAAAFAASPLRTVSVFDSRTHISSDETIALVRAVLAAHQLLPTVGGGTRAYFAELNRMRPPGPQPDFITYTANPQVHATDSTSIMKTPPALARTVLDATGIAAGKPLHVGPLTFAPRYNPVATTPGASVPGPADEFADARQDGPLAAAWTVAALAALLNTESISAFQTAGPHGLVTNTVHPATTQIYDVLAWWAARDGAMLDTAADPRVACMAARDPDESIHLLLANASDDQLDIEADFADPAVRPVRLTLGPWQRHTLAVRPERLTAPNIPTHRPSEV